VKGFPNQVVDLAKLATGMQALVRLVEAGHNAKDDGVFGEDLVRAGVAGTGHTPIAIERYLREQRRRRPSNQSFRTTARGLRELYRLFGLIDDSGARIAVTDLSRQVAAFADRPFDSDQTDFWRRVIRNVIHGGGEPEASHPYQVLLRLVARKPGITRAKCALALEARNDSPEELDRIARLADLPEEQILRRIGVTEANWDNAKKVLPSLAEQLGDVIVTRRRRERTYRLADAPGRADAGPAAARAAVPPARPARGVAVAVPRAPRTSRQVTPEAIGRAGTLEQFDEEPPTSPAPDPAAIAAANRRRLDRLRRHNLVVQGLAARLAAAGAQLHEDPFDILALIGAVGILVEVKTLDGTEEDERERVRDALAQLLYYEPFAAAPVVGQAAIHKIACFERPISADHRVWLNASGIGVIWSLENGRFAGDALGARVLGGYLEELR